jgi:hypothetical protein
MIQPNEGYRLSNADAIEVGDIISVGSHDVRVVEKRYEGDMIIVGTIPPSWGSGKANNSYRMGKYQSVDIKE